VPRPPREGRALDLLGLPRPAGGGVRGRAPARVRRRRAHGRPRRDQPGRRGGAPPLGVPRAAGVRGPRPDPPAHPAGLGDRPVGEARAERGHGRRPRRGGRRRAPAVPLAAGVRGSVRRGRRRPRAADRDRVRGREHVPVARVAAGGAGLRAALGPRRARLRPHHPRRLARRDCPGQLRGARPPARRLAAPRAPDRRDGERQGRAPGARPGRPAGRGAAGPPRGCRFRGQPRRRGQHPPVRWPCGARRRPGRSARLHPAPLRPGV
ncbi:MAG: Sugar phosphate isomerases/epimerases, partial [uncultured Nocardioidaceae bacterium]